MKGNIIRLNTLHLNSASMNGVREVQGSSASGGGGIVPNPHIQFADAEVERVLMANGVSSDGIGITIEDVEKVTSIGTWFRDNGLIKSFLELSLFSNLKKIGGDTLGYSAFYSCDQLQSLSFPENAESIGAYCLYQCNNLSIDISQLPKSIKSLGVFAFQGVTTTGVLDLPNLEGTINWANFNDVAAKQLEGIENLGAITSIAGFMKQEKLRYVNIPQTCADIATNAFSGCFALEQVICRATTPPTLGTTVFSGSTCPIYVPDASLEAYKTATNWNTYADRIHPLSEIEGSLVFYDKLVGDGTAYIKTDLMPNSFDNYEFDVSRAKNWNKFVFGSKSDKMSVGAVIYSDSKTFYLYTPNSTASTEVTTGNGERMHRGLRTISLGDGKYRREEYRLHDGNDDEVRTLIASTSIVDETSTMPLLVLACNVTASSNNPDRLYDGAIYSFIVTDSRTTEVRMSLKPCTWNGEAGMWDEVGNKFYGNAAASGEFSVAND